MTPLRVSQSLRVRLGSRAPVHLARGENLAGVRGVLLQHVVKLDDSLALIRHTTRISAYQLVKDMRKELGCPVPEPPDDDRVAAQARVG